MQEQQIKISVLFIAVFMYGLYMVKLLTCLLYTSDAADE